MISSATHAPASNTATHQQDMPSQNHHHQPKAHPSSTSASHTQFALSFERLTVESLALPWHRLEEIHELIHDKRKQVEHHTSVAMEHLRSISMTNAEIHALEKEFSAVMSTVVAERARTQEKLRALVLEWERTHISLAGEKLAEVQREHSAELATAHDEIKQLKKEMRDRSKLLETTQRSNEQMSSILKQYQLDQVGPLMESIQSRHVSNKKAAGTSGGGDHGGKGGSLDTSLMMADLSVLSHTLAASLPQRADASVDASGITPTTRRADEADQLREEVFRLQGELAVARRESKLRRDEVDALRSAREDMKVMGAASVPGGPALPQLPSSAISVAASDVPHSFYQLQQTFGSSRSVASTQSVYSGDRRVLSSSSFGLQQRTSRSGEEPLTAVAIGLDLGNRRQQSGLAGVHVVSVAEDSPAYAAGMRSNDVVVAWGGFVVNKLEDVAAVTRSLPSDSQFLEIKFLRPGTASRDAPGIVSDEDIYTAQVPLHGRLEGPYNGRREHYSS